jgi:hypothetical protein
LDPRHDALPLAHDRFARERPARDQPRVVDDAPQRVDVMSHSLDVQVLDAEVVLAGPVGDRGGDDSGEAVCDQRLEGAGRLAPVSESGPGLEQRRVVVRQLERKTKVVGQATQAGRLQRSVFERMPLERGERIAVFTARERQLLQPGGDEFSRRFREPAGDDGRPDPAKPFDRVFDGAAAPADPDCVSSLPERLLVCGPA